MSKVDEKKTFYREGQSEGALFQNRRKERDSQPDVEGRVLLHPEDLKALYEEAKKTGGATLWLNGWNKQGKNGAFISLSPRAGMRAKEGRSGDNDSGFFGGDQKSGGGSSNLDDEIPFAPEWRV